MKTFLVRLVDGKTITVKADQFSRPQMAIFTRNEYGKEVCGGTFNMDKIQFIVDVQLLGDGKIKEK